MPGIAPSTGETSATRPQKVAAEHNEPMREGFGKQSWGPDSKMAPLGRIPADGRWGTVLWETRQAAGGKGAG